MNYKILPATWLLLIPIQVSAESSEYMMTDICRSALHVMLNRDISVMQAESLSDGSARIKFTRQQDGKKFSYRCRSTDGTRLGILDETLSGARWYGEQPDDIQRSYRIKEGRLIIHSFYQGNGDDASFSHTDFPVHAASQENDIEPLNHYGKLLAESYSTEKLRLVKAYHVTTKPMNAYRLDFETSAKALLSQPGGDENPKIHAENESKAEAWQSKFC
jgi:hypothetical protein